MDLIATRGRVNSPALPGKRERERPLSIDYRTHGQGSSMPLHRKISSALTPSRVRRCRQVLVRQLQGGKASATPAGRLLPTERPLPKRAVEARRERARGLVADRAAHADDAVDLLAQRRGHRVAEAFSTSTRASGEALAIILVARCRVTHVSWR